MLKTVYYKSFHLGNEKYRVVTRERMTNEDFVEKTLYVRRLMGYAMYPRWFATRMFLGEVYDILRKNNLLKHRVRKAANMLNAHFDTFERLHTMDFDAEWIEVMGGSVANAVLPKINMLRGSVGGVLLNEGIKNYIVYSYPETLCVLAYEGVKHHDELMEEVKEKYGMDLSEVYRPLRGGKVLADCYSLMSAVEDMIGETLPSGVDARKSDANRRMKELDKLLWDDKVLRKSIEEAAAEVEERDQTADDVAMKLSEKFNVKRL